MTFGWKRAEILGAVMNGCFLLALCLYIVLEAIPKFIKPSAVEGDWWFIGTAAAGLGVNLIGTIIFAGRTICGIDLTFGVTGHGHSHAGGGGHGHSHGGHGHKDKHGHKEKHGHGHKDKHGHKEKKKGHKHGHDEIVSINSEMNEEKAKEDMNIRAVFLHYLGDAISSAFVLAAGLIMHYYPDKEWVVYVDPASRYLAHRCLINSSSLLIVILVLASIIPLLKDCSKILLQQVPSDIDASSLKKELEQVWKCLQ